MAVVAATTGGDTWAVLVTATACGMLVVSAANDGEDCTVLIVVLAASA